MKNAVEEAVYEAAPDILEILEEQDQDKDHGAHSASQLVVLK
jgi:hypothetical protein